MRGSVLALLAVLASASASATCPACTLIFGLIEEWWNVHVGALGSPLKSSMTASEMRTTVCARLPEGSLAARSCGALAADDERRPLFLHALVTRRSPDDLCADFKFCTGGCRLFRTWPVYPPANALWSAVRPASMDHVDTLSLGIRVMENMAVALARGSIEAFERALGLAPALLQETGPAMDPFFEATKRVARVIGNPCGLDLKCDIDRLFSKHLPLKDNDDDWFVGDGLLTRGFRGRDWRGEDCDDTDASVYPGRRPQGGDASRDSNCNDISGVDATSGVAIEEAVCAGTNPKGVVVLGDSAAAHFHIPGEWFNMRQISWSSLASLIPAAQDELDWPQCSWATGHAADKECPPSAVPLKSIYQRMLERNRCIRNDFQNIAVNGARTGSMVDIVKSFRRDQQNDNPALVFYALIGNDVCNGHPGTASMTTPEQFEKNVLTSLQYLDTVLPQNSTVVFFGLADGLVLYKYMHAEVHPLGIPYPDLYDYLNCNECSPCRGWMNSNATMRQLTQDRADLLSAVYPKVIRENKFKHFDMLYYRPDWEGLIAEYVAAGGRAADVIEPVDGFHPSQTGQNLLAEQVWNWLEQNHPGVLTGVNPHNAAIDAILKP